MRRFFTAAIAAICTALSATALAQNISIGTGGTGGVYYPMGGGMAAVLSKYVPGMQAAAEVTGGSVDNLKLTSIEGLRAYPRQRPPYPAQSGLWGKPTVINNVETWANVPSIIRRGAAWFSGLGTATSKGTKIFSLVGKINNTGLVEVPMGIRLRDIVYAVGGGIPKGREFKAVQIGGPSGGCIPKEHWGLPIDFDSLWDAGAMMGSGGMIVMDNSACMVDVAKFFLDFLIDESCGKCIPCRLGLKRMREILEEFSAGKGSVADLEELQSLAEAVKDGSLCALGGSAPNPVLSTLHYFREEYEAHILEHKCPAAVCKELITYAINQELCNGCTACVQECPQGAISGVKKEPHQLNPGLCIKSGACHEVCKFGAVEVF